MKAIILDMYGVILKDTGDGFYSFVNNFFPDLTINDIYPIWNKADVGEISSLEVFAQIGFKGNLAKIEKEYLDSIEINDGFYDFAERAKKQCKLALISNDSSEWSKYMRAKFTINEYFDVITVSGDVKMRKPDERIFKTTIEQLGCKANECIYIDDRKPNLEAAELLGMDTILFNTGNCDYCGKTTASFRQLTDMLKL